MWLGLLAERGAGRCFPCTFTPPAPQPILAASPDVLQIAGAAELSFGAVEERLVCPTSAAALGWGASPMRRVLVRANSRVLRLRLWDVGVNVGMFRNGSGSCSRGGAGERLSYMEQQEQRFPALLMSCSSSNHPAVFLGRLLLTCGHKGWLALMPQLLSRCGKDGWRELDPAWE